MNIKHWILLGLVVVSTLVIGQAITVPGPLNIAQAPLFARASLPPLNMLVMGRDHKLYYEAYNDASDLDGDGVLDVGYKPAIDYYGYYNSKVCYDSVHGATGGQLFRPVAVAGGSNGKQCSGHWSGDFLNYLTTSRMDALRKVLFGGYREVDSDSETILRAAFIPQDAHSWGKEYAATDNYDISHYAPLSRPSSGRRHLFAVTTLSDNGVPQLRVLNNTTFRVWNWVSIERPVAGDDCFDTNSNRLNCVTGSGSAGGWEVVPVSAYSGPVQITTWRDNVGNPGNQSEMDALFAGSNSSTLCGSWSATSINAPGTNNNQRAGTNGCTHDGYHTLIRGELNITEAGTYRFAVNGDDAVDVFINGNFVAGWYGGHGQDNSANTLNSHSGEIYLGVGSHAVVFRHEEGGGDDNWQLYWQPLNGGGATAMTNYPLRVEVCPATEALREDNCKTYPNNTTIKPTGILHDYGETDRMYFGLLSGSNVKNTSGGVLRSNMASFAREINPTTGQFCLNGNCGTGRDVDGIVATISRFRMLDFNYGSHAYGCGWITTRPVNEGQCWMWGNPVGEMMYETLRYFGGAENPRAEFDYTGGVDTDTLHLPKPSWVSPYKAQASGGGGYPMCAQPTMTVLSDINPSYDYGVPGTNWGTVSSAGDPASVQGLNVSTEVDRIWADEGGGSRTVFIGESNGISDNAPTPKVVSNLSTVRGLSPEEPSKQGTYYSAGVARYGAKNKIGGDKYVRTYAVAMASPLPKFEFPVGDGKITLVPFAKSVGGYSIDASSNFQPTNQIVDFYVQKVANTGANDRDAAVNGGRPYAEFRINFEDVEQGADHDMDAITLYTLAVNAAGQLVVRLDSEYAAGGIDQYMGYVISGTTKDGVYLEVKDRGGADRTYRLSTPAGRDPGYCAATTPPADCSSLPLQATRTFDVGASAGAGLLHDPLWYAAKYGTDQGWDADGDGIPDNYFLVTNPLNLRRQLTKAFDAIQDQQGQSGTLSIAGGRVNSSSYAVVPTYASSSNGHDWTGDLKAYNIGSDGLLATERWSAAARLFAKSVADRKIFTALSNVNNTNRTAAVQEFKATEWGGTTAEMFARLGYTLGQVTSSFGGSVRPEQFMNYLRGERSMEGVTKNTAPFRRRSSVLGDIINSSPVIATNKANYGWASAAGLTAAQRTSYTTYVAGKSTRNEHVFVGANDGMLHAFDNTGEESFAYIPNGVLSNMGRLAEPLYEHRYFVDGNLSLSDVLIGTDWETVLVGATGAGGRSVFGLNVSSPGAFGASKVLWEVNSLTDADVGHVMGKPLIVPTENGRWVAIFGNGYNSVNGDPVLFVVDIATGAVVKKLAPDDGDAVNPNGLGSISAIDTNGNGLVDTVYGGDLLGNVWKFDVSAVAESDWSVSFGGDPLFTAVDGNGNRQPITGAFEVAVGPGAGYMVYFGTGRYFVTGDNDATLGQPVQSLYAIWDNGTALTSGRSTLVQQQITSEIDGTTDTRVVTRNAVSYLVNRGWYLDLAVGNVANATGERFIATPRIQSGKVYFATYQPGVASDCVPGGKNWLYALDPLSGGAAFGQISLPPSGTVGDGDTGGVSTGNGAPSRDVGVTQPQPVSPVYCDPSDPSCVTPTSPSTVKCSEVIIDPSNPTSPLVVQRACGRQSWRQLL